MAKNPTLAGRIVLENGGVIERADGVDIIAVNAAGDTTTITGTSTVTGASTTFTVGTDQSFAKEVNHNLIVTTTTTAATAGGNLAVKAGQGATTGAGGQLSAVGGASGTGATGNGGNVLVTGGAAASTNGNGGSVQITAGALAGTGVNGVIYERSPVSKKTTVTAMTTSATVTVAAILGGLITANQGAAGAATYTLPTGTALAAALPSDFTVGDSVQFTIVNISTVDAEDVTVAGDTGTTMIGNVTVEAKSAVTKVSQGTFRAINSGANTFNVYRVA